MARTVVARGLGSFVWTMCTAAAIAGQPQSPPAIPANATRLEGTPTVKVEVTEAGAKRQTLSGRDAAAETLSISLKDGRMFWTSRGGRPLTLTAAGDMTYLSSSTEPGRYVRLRTVNDKLTYVEHLDMGPRSVTYWGELRVVLSK
jgi:hypothetical protein